MQRNRNIKLFIIISISSIIIICSILFFIINRHERFLLPIIFPDAEIIGKTNPKIIDFEEKLWLHRVNNIDKLKALESIYKGLEIDIIFDDHHEYFYVSHDPISEPLLSLNDLFENVDDINSHYFWLDVKNLNSENYHQAFEHLKDLSLKYELMPSNIIIESENPHLLSVFTNFGFITSYYMPTFNPYEIDENDIIKYAKEIDISLQKSNVNFISTHYLSYHFIKKYFPDSQILMWDTRNDWINKFYIEKKLIKDEKVKVILIRDKDINEN